MLHLRRFGAGREIVALHGFSLTGEQFAPSAALLNCTILAPDLPGHGSSRLQSTVLADVTAAIGTHIAERGEPLPLLGYSQGARVALLTALDTKLCISALVLISAHAGISNSAQRARRMGQDAERATEIERVGIEGFLEAWRRTGLTSVAHLSAEHRAWDRGVREENTSHGLASALIGYGQGAQPSVWNRLQEIAVPTLLVAGEQDEKYTEIAQSLNRGISGSELAIIKGAGHNPLADRPEITHAVISRFLDHLG